jgi:hypothetical protein
MRWKLQLSYLPLNRSVGTGQKALGSLPAVPSGLATDGRMGESPYKGETRGEWTVEKPSKSMLEVMLMSDEHRPH